MKRVVYSLAVVVLMVMATGCRTIGQDFDQQVVTRIEKGKTTKAQIQDWLGAPYEKGIQEGLDLWTYTLIKATISDETKKDLSIWFEKSGVVNTFTYTTNYAPWQVSK